MFQTCTWGSYTGWDPYLETKTAKESRDAAMATQRSARKYSHDTRDRAHCALPGEPTGPPRKRPRTTLAAAIRRGCAPRGSVTRSTLLRTLAVPYSFAPKVSRQGTSPCLPGPHTFRRGRERGHLRKGRDAGLDRGQKITQRYYDNFKKYNTVIPVRDPAAASPRKNHLPKKKRKR